MQRPEGMIWEESDKFDPKRASFALKMASFFKQVVTIQGAEALKAWSVEIRKKYTSSLYKHSIKQTQMIDVYINDLSRTTYVAFAS